MIGNSCIENFKLTLEKKKNNNGPFFNETAVADVNWLQPTQG